MSTYQPGQKIAGPIEFKADVLILLYTEVETRAFLDVFTGNNDWSATRRAAWYHYAHNFASISKDIEGIEDSDALKAGFFGYLNAVKIGDQKVAIFKSELHAKVNGNKLPIVPIIQQLATELQPALVISTGSAGGIGSVLNCGDVAVTSSARFRVTTNYPTYPEIDSLSKSNRALVNSVNIDDKYLKYAAQNLTKLTLPSLAQCYSEFAKRSGYSFLKKNVAPPSIYVTDLNPLPGRQPMAIVTADFLSVDDSSDAEGLQALGIMNDNDDAYAFFALSQLPKSQQPQWLSVRNASDPQVAVPSIPAGTPQSKIVAELSSLAGAIFGVYEYVTTIDSAFACWAIVAGKASATDASPSSTSSHSRKEKSVKTTPLAGSNRRAMRSAKLLGPTLAEQRLEVTVMLRRRTPLGAFDGTVLPRNRTYLTHDQLAAQHGAEPGDISRVEAFALAAGLAVVDSSPARRSVLLSGKVAEFEKAFGVKLEDYEHPTRGTFRGRTGTIHVPDDLNEIVEAVFGLDNRPFARPHHVRLRAGHASNFAGYKPTLVAEFYNFPTGVDGAGQTIGIIELGGGYRPADVAAYFKQIGVPAPHVKAFSVDRGRNAPTNANSADGEVMLDIEVAGAVAPRAKIVVYFAAGTTDKDFLDAISAAVHDSVNNPSVISISWGGPEVETTESFQQQFEQILQSAAALGITATIASGDSRAADEGPNEWDGTAHVDFPASCPHALSCGGTHIAVTGKEIASESVWNQNAADSQSDSFGASGGGISGVFPLPSYQQNAKVPVNVNTKKPGRGVPDVAGDADPASGYLVRVDGQEFPIGGTSAVAPLWAGLIALCNQSIGRRVGFVNPLLYANPSAFNDITKGNNRVGSDEVGYDAGSGWDACTGLGSPNGQKVLAALGGSQK